MITDRSRSREAMSRLQGCVNCPEASLEEEKLVCAKTGAAVGFFTPGLTCPMGRWREIPKIDLAAAVAARAPTVEFDEQDKALFIAFRHGPTETELDALYTRVPGQLRWLVGDKSLVDKAWSFGKSVTSGALVETRPEDAAILARRRLSCFGDPALAIAPCPALKKDGQGSYCGGCSCGAWKLAQLDGVALPKLRWRFLTCPLKRPGFSNAATA